MKDDENYREIISKYTDRIISLIELLSNKKCPEIKPLCEELVREIYFVGYAKGYKEKGRETP